MKKPFIQKRIQLGEVKSTGIIKISTVCELIKDHPYKELILDEFNVKNISQEYIHIKNIDIVYNHIKAINLNFKRFKIQALTKDINLFQEEIKEEDVKNSIYFKFGEYQEDNITKTNLKATAIYNSKNSFLDEYDMTKFANSLFKKKKTALSSLVSYNINFFKELAQNEKTYNKNKSYRLVKHDGKTYLRGITSERYNEYGVDFTFVISMLIIHQNMKLNTGLNYEIKDCSLNESKLELIVNECHTKDVSPFGKISTAIKISTNDLGNESLRLSNIIYIENRKGNQIPIYPRVKKIDRSNIIINHSTKPENVLTILRNIDGVLNTTDEFIQELKSLKTVRTPDELRVKILSKIENPRSPLKGIFALSDLFKRKIDNEINNFKILLEICGKAEELDLEYDLKDKLRYIISDIILYGKTK